jgi:hypothetical protein
MRLRARQSTPRSAPLPTTQLDRRALRWRIFVVAAASALAATAAAQDAAIEGSREKSLRVVRTSVAPIIDGILDDEAWRTAAVIEDLHQVQPTEYAPPSQRTKIYVTYDDNALYVAARLFDTQPNLIVDRILRQGDQVFGDDWFSLIIDPFHDRRSGYRFLTNPNGIRQEGIFQNVSDTQWEWQGIWETAASKNDEGWVTEIAIPFKSLSFDPNNDTWGINFRRAVARGDERMAWVSRNRNTDPSTSGIAVGFEGLQQGRGLDVIPSIALANQRTIAIDDGDPATPLSPTLTKTKTDPSLDIFYKISPSVTGALTINTDFSATEVDDRQVNLTRFGLFFPEKRDFFLQDADIFEFGGLDDNGRPFFSRRIGLAADGQPVDLIVGGKISGRVGRFNIGALTIRQDEYAEIQADNAVVARVSANVLRESTIGLIATEGDPQSNEDNSVTGADFAYRNSRLPGGKLVETNVWMQQSNSPDAIDANNANRAYGFRVSTPNNSGFRGGVRFTHIEENFAPALGFVNRAGIQQFNTGVQYTARPRNSYFRSILGGFNAERVERLSDGELESQSIRLRLIELENTQGDKLELEHRISDEVLFEPFEIHPGIVIPTDAYAFEAPRLSISTADQRRVWGNVSYGSGSFYDGTRDESIASISWRPSGKLRTTLSYEYNDIALPEGSFETRLVQFRAVVAFSSMLSWVTFVQYDNISETIGINSRIHWIPQAGREAFLVLNHNLQDIDNRDNHFKSSYSEVALKFNYTFRF